MEIYRHLKTPDGTVLISKNRHDYVSHVDRVDGKEYFLDGGINNGYFRWGGEGELLTVTTSSPHEVIREYYTLTTCFSGYIPIKYISVDDLDDITERYVKSPDKCEYSSLSDKEKETLIFIREKQWRNIDEEVF